MCLAFQTVIQFVSFSLDIPRALEDTKAIIFVSEDAFTRHHLLSVYRKYSCSRFSFVFFLLLNLVLICCRFCCCCCYCCYCCSFSEGRYGLKQKLVFWCEDKMRIYFDIIRWLLRKREVPDSIITNMDNLFNNVWDRVYHSVKHYLILIVIILHVTASNVVFIILTRTEIAHSDYSKTCLKRPLSKRPKIGFQDQLSLNTGEHSVKLLTFIKLPCVIKIFVVSVFEGYGIKTTVTIVLECPSLAIEN